MGIEDYQFKVGREKTGGRQKGTRNKLSEAFLRDLHNEWERSGAQTLKILAVENPAALAAIVAKVIPQAFDADAPAVLHIVTGVPRHGDYAERTPTIPTANVVALAPKADDGDIDD